MNKVIDYLKEKGVIKTLQLSVNLAKSPEEWDEETEKKHRNEALKECLKFIIRKDETLKDLFAEFATDYALDAIVNELNIERNENYIPTKFEKALMAFNEALFDGELK